MRGRSEGALVFDILIVCTLTALAILVTGVWQSGESNGISLTIAAFGSSFPVYGKYLLMLAVAAFSISSLSVILIMVRNVCRI